MGLRRYWPRLCRAGGVFGLCILAGLPAAAQQEPQRTTLNFNGVTGLIDMPTGEAAPDGQFSWNVSTFAGQTHTALSFQITPRLGGSFRYTGIQNWNFDGFATYYDRSFDLRYRVIAEGRFLPAVTVGMQDFIGTGLFAGEYVAATKSLTPRLRVTAGLGWGRLGSYRAIGTPFGVRPAVDVGRGGKPNFGQWFRGPAAPFLGVEWQPTDRLGIKAEYSSDDYSAEAGRRGVFARRSPWNFALEYQVTPALRYGISYMYGSEVGLSLAIAVDPTRRPRNLGIQGPAPLPVKRRPDPALLPGAWSQDWASAPDPGAALRPVLAQVLAADGMRLEALALSPTRAHLRLRNLRYDADAQAIGRAARILSQILPASVEVFEIVPVVDGVAQSRVTIRRSDLEALENAPEGSRRLQERVVVADAGRLPPGAVTPDDVYPGFSWKFGPYTRLSFFDPSQPVRADFGLRLSGKLTFAPGLVLSASVAQKLIGNLGKSSRQSNSVLPHVRSDATIYDLEGGTSLESLTLAWTARPGRNLYSRVTFGYLERQFGGISGEVLWKPVNSRLALGIEANYAVQRDFNQKLGFRDYDVLTGHVSGYYDLGKGYLAQVDVGRYLAGDVGATFAINREFPNGWKVGAFATFTNVSASDFGEGSFDKGITITVPLAWIAGQPSRKTYSSTIRPLTRDGGARLQVDGRLYEAVRGYHTRGLDAQWGRVFR